MIRFTTPRQEFSFSINPQENFNRIVISYVQRGKIIIEKEKSDLTFSTDGEGDDMVYIASFVMTQEETGKLSHSAPVEIQVRVLTYNDEALASDIVTCTVEDVLKKEVLYAN